MFEIGFREILGLAALGVAAGIWLGYHLAELYDRTMHNDD